MTIDCFLLQKNDFRRAKLRSKRSENAHHRKNLQEVTTLHKKRQVLDTNDYRSR